MRAAIERLRRGIPRGFKDPFANMMLSPGFGRLVRGIGVKTVRHRGGRVRIDHPRVSPRQIASLVWAAYERAEAEQIEQFVGGAEDVVELGASMGVNTVLIASKLGPGKRLISVEADPDLAELARGNVALNRNADQVTIIAAALAYDVDTVTFTRGASALGGSIMASAEGQRLTVPAVTLSALTKAHGMSRYTLVMDIEGAEWDLLQRPDELAGCNKIIAELHSVEGPNREVLVSVDQMIARFQQIGFRLLDRYGVCVVFGRV